MRVIGIDIGGANLKASDGQRQSASRSFAIWQEPERLGDELRLLLSSFDPPQHLAVTMTAELADCFSSKADGVDRILTSIEAVVDLPIHVWQRGGEFVTPADARELWMLVAAANWHALATWAGRMTPSGTALLIDIGSTTTDIIPLVNGFPETIGGSDVERLAAGELVYTGVRRTPVCAVAATVMLADRTIPLAAELFATMQDVALILGDTVSPHADISGADDAGGRADTADGRSATVDHARSRLARMLCCDRTEVSDDDLLAIARQLRASQAQQITRAFNQVLASFSQTPTNILLSGEGEQLARQIIASHATLADCEVISLGDAIGAEHSTSACAFALARLGEERIR